MYKLEYIYVPESVKVELIKDCKEFLSRPRSSSLHLCDKTQTKR